MIDPDSLFLTDANIICDKIVIQDYFFFSIFRMNSIDLF